MKIPVWRSSGALLDDISHVLRDGTAAGNGSDDLRERGDHSRHEGLMLEFTRRAAIKKSYITG